MTRDAEGAWESRWVDGPGWDRPRDDDDMPEEEGPPPAPMTKGGDDDYGF